MFNSNSTIAAIATPPGRGGVGIIRISGKLVPDIAKQILGKLPKPRFAEFANFLGENKQIIDSGIALYFKAPHSFTGEDVLELQGHGGSIILDILLQRIISLGARLAKPGEFSKRAFLNDKIDLTQAEAIADLIDASSHQAAINSTKTLQGEFSKHIKLLLEMLIDLRVLVESAIDFAEEEIEVLNKVNFTKKIDNLVKKLAEIKNAAKQGVLIKAGITLVIAGKPNVGKSSLLNILSGEETAIVTNIPGTTRDVLHTHIQIDGLPIHLIDTAGIQETKDIIEQEGIKRTWREIKNAEYILLLVDSSKETERDPKKLFQDYFHEIAKQKMIVVFNKIDLTKENARLNIQNDFTKIFLSAKTGDGVGLLKQHLKTTLGYSQTNECGFSARLRHLEALARVEKNLREAQISLEANTLEILAENLRQGQNALGEITGEFTTDDLLDKIFSEFCIGK